jgi:tRNA(Ile)-lysidine synthase
MLRTRFIQNIIDKKLFSPTDPLLIAVSGGVDSVVLCDLCSRSGFAFAIAHANFQLRGTDSVMDECFVKGLADNYRVRLHVRKFDTLSFAEANRVSVQVAARELRYAWFHEVLGNDNYRYLLTAHHADDNIETIVMNFFRGTGITGLRGMLSRHGNIVRPLLFASKAEILKYAKERRLTWREDSSNASDKYSRNYFRNAILPMVYKIFPEVESNLEHNIARFADAEELYRQAIDAHKKSLIEQRANEYHIPVLKLKKASPLNTILYEITREFNFTPHQLADVLHLLDAEQGKYVDSSTHRIIRNRAWIIIVPRESLVATNIVIDAHDEVVNFDHHALQVTTSTTDHIHFSKLPSVAELDKKQIKFPLLLRKWRPGDYFYPLGMKKKKKISRFLIDQKLSPTEKERVWVVESGKRICWVVGMRIDERFKIVASTNEVLKLKITT